MAKGNSVQTKSKNDPGKYDFLKVAKYFAIGSLVITAASILHIVFAGFNYGIDFAGGTEVQVQFSKPVEASRVRQFTADVGAANASVQAFGATNEYLIRLGLETGASDQQLNDKLNATIKKITDGLTTQFAAEGASIRQVNTVGPQVGAELKRNGILALFYALLVILIYVGLRFDYAFAPGTVFCLFHDAIFTLGIYSLLGWEVSTQTMAAVLTLIGYSLNDTIVIYDRVRENLQIFRDESFSWIINRSINDCLSRTILTTGTTFLAVASLWILAGGVIADFARTMAIGMILGTYSTVYVAAPLVILAEKWRTGRAQAVGHPVKV